MSHDLHHAIDALLPAMRAELEELVRIPSVSAAGYDAEQVRRSAERAAELLTESGYTGVRLLELDGAHPGVFGEMPGPDGAPTVLLYAHHDVQPPGPVEEWDATPFEPFERDGRLYGRGTSDDKCGIVIHTAVARAFDGKPPVRMKVFIEGEEEIGSLHLDQFIERYKHLLAADAIVIADSGNLKAGQPTLTTSLRGLVDVIIEVRTLEVAVHSGMYGGAIPDALTSLIKTLATLHADDGTVAIPGLVATDDVPFDIEETMLRETAGMVEGVDLIGTGSIVSRMWTRPAISVLALDAPRVADAINQLIPVARAKVSMRIAPGQDPEAAMSALTRHLEDNVPWNAQVTVTRGAAGQPFALDSAGATYDAFRTGFRQAYGVDAIDIGVGGSIPFVAAFSDAYPDAGILLIGAGDGTSRAHGPNESLDLEEFRKTAIAEAIALRELAGNG
ncbi:MAG: dipeptidase [Acidimicrobiia bacterium]|nr:dipeptidase [Acidimicrobiia bacterium]